MAVYSPHNANHGPQGPGAHDEDDEDYSQKGKASLVELMNKNFLAGKDKLTAADEEALKGFKAIEANKGFLVVYGPGGTDPCCKIYRGGAVAVEVSGDPTSKQNIDNMLRSAEVAARTCPPDGMGVGAPSELEKEMLIKGAQLAKMPLANKVDPNDTLDKNHPDIAKKMEAEWASLHPEAASTKPSFSPGVTGLATQQSALDKQQGVGVPFGAAATNTPAPAPNPTGPQQKPQPAATPQPK